MRKKFSALLMNAVLIVSLSAIIGGCALMKSEEKYRRLPRVDHESEFPRGHDGSHICYFDEKNDVYFCPY